MDLNAYLPYFKSMIDRKIGWTISNPEDGIVRVGYPLYDKPMLEFTRKFRASAEYDPHYRKTLKANRIKPRVDEATIAQVLKSDDVSLIGAMISLIVDWEEVEEGTWAQALQSGELYRLTKHLAELTSQRPQLEK
ncbi:DUF6508 domain-containing protein [Limosilactobacillus mucosae]|uniref:DUF6508 domain-containing protein n=1 Tax=Limosilactobacillus mucosae TaxID=97478 RepID=UPI00065279C8|nr:DUF6508 domain-containing protein [Limosilactobacillus mucosae]